MGDAICSVPNCPDPLLARGLCSKHYQRQRKLGSVDGYDERLCQQCTAAFRPSIGFQLYCSKACLVAAQIDKRRGGPLQSVECRNCHRPFLPSRAGQVHCSRSCLRAHHQALATQRAREARAERPPLPASSCAECDAEFWPATYNQGYCSVACKRTALLRRRRAIEYQPTPLTCEECGQDVPYKSGRRRFCSDKCRRRSAAKDARWQVKGLTRDHGMVEECGLCGVTERLDIDHDHQCCPGERSCGECVREFLCRGHNIGLGLFGDDPALLRAAADYIERHRALIT